MTYYGFLDQVVEHVKGSLAFRDRLGDYHEESNFSDPDNVTLSEAAQFIVGDDHGYFFALTDGDHETRKRTYDLMPFAEVVNQSHSEFSPNGSCGDQFTGLESSWRVYFFDKARGAAADDIDADPLASMRDFTQWISDMLEQFKLLNIDKPYYFSTIRVAQRPLRLDPMKRTPEFDYWMCAVEFQVEEGA